MAAKISPSVFETGADDSLKVVDVYNAQEVMDASGLGIELPTLPTLNFDATKATYDEFINLTPTQLGGITLSLLLRGTLSNNQLRMLFKGNIPPNVSPRAFLLWLDNEDMFTVMSALTGYTVLFGPGGLGSLSEPEWIGLMTLVVAGYVWGLHAYPNTPDVGIRMGTTTNTINTSGVMGVTDLVVPLLSATLAPRTVDIETINNQVIQYTDLYDTLVPDNNPVYVPDLYRTALESDPPIYGDYVVLALIELASLDGNMETVSVLTNMTSVPISPVVRRRTIQRMLMSFVREYDTPLEVQATAFIDSLYTVDPMWDKYIRNGNIESDLTLYKHASPDARKALLIEVRTTEAMVAVGNSSINPRKTSSVARGMYPGLYFR